MNHQILSLFLLATFFIGDAAPSSASEKPNILFIAIDDLRPELACYGVEGIHSPNIDRLAESGVLFDRAYCQLAVCNPSRVSLMTGLRPDSAKVWTLDVQFRNTVPDVVTLPQQFMKHDYYALSYGKIFHNPWPDNVSWNEPHQWPENSQLWSNKAKNRLTEYRKKMQANGKSAAAIKRMRPQATEIVDIPDSQHIDGAIADQALTAMRRLAKKNEPFFLAAGFVRPHLPFVVPRKYWDLYDREKIPLAKNDFLPSGAPDFALNTMYELRDYLDFANSPDPRNGSLTESQRRRLKHGYYASVSFIDAQVGRLLDELNKLGLADHTIIVLWSDHGWKLGEHNSWCKQSNYEIDARVPLIIRVPGARGNGQSTRALVELVDIYPTLCELADIPVPDHAGGDSLVPILNDPGITIKDAAISQFPRRDGKRNLMGYTMRTDQFRYVEWIDRRTKKAIDFELYDHANDPGENTNIAGNADQKKRLKQLSEQLWKILPPPPEFVAAAPKKSPRPIVRFQNDREETIHISWIPKGGKPKRLGEILPGKSMVQNTTKGHRFLIEGTKSDLRKTVTATKADKTIVLSPGKPRAKDRPNILFLMADDWSWPHAGALGDPVVKTPTFDRMVKEGVLFEHAFVSAPSCTPSRHSIASGQYHWRPGVGVDLGSSIAKETPVYPDLLTEAGYVTGFSRKGTAPSKHEFRGNDPFGPKFKNFEEFYAQRKSGKPFCFWYGSGEPHRPYDWQASKRAGIKLDAIRVPACLPDNETVRTDLGDYYLKVQRFDRDSARMIALLEKNGELDNTIIIMSGDNGMPFPRCKATLYDFGTRVPLVIRWGKKVKGGRTIEDFVSLTDLAPTFLEAAGLSIPKQMSGRSLMPQLASEKSGYIEPTRDHVLTGMERHVYPYPSRAIRTADFLYIRNFAPSVWPSGVAKGKQPHFDFTKTPWPTIPGAFSYNVDPGPAKQWMRENAMSGKYAELYRLAFGPRAGEELYDLKSDPDQLNNVADNPDYAAVRKTLSDQLTKELRESADPRFALAEHASFSVKGWTIHLNDRLWRSDPAACNRMLGILAGQLGRVVDVVPAEALKHLRTVPIWINPTYEGKRPGAEYHPDVAWLRKVGRNPAMAKCIEITNVSIFPFENRRMPYLLLHELAHAYHDQVLGFDQPEIRRAFQHAKNSGSYGEVKRFNGKSIVMDKAYAMSNHKEYFAELSEAYFGKNDFFPFDRKELKAHDPTGFKVIEQAWKVR